ncbi:DUF2800 domain-containing protein [Paenibacillus sp. HN-1]|uniref:DUF2800 domain-containing protein n=1 Tax=Paenibacillus TaxID=44249 RepID=UPI001CA928DC|nr:MULTISPECIES: DUF2800 domain-containing protein [Paenibacillus]MBY9078275.1 DUF2800 domain-containing protein [Paenibacillus sp. CGMCC 1.18879]MBY9086066.1 DUF2800 domain-containing protein [Paenibacillus sinensis]
MAAGEIAHAERAHALLSASGAHRWLHCPPSARLEATLPDTESEAAKRGTLAHEIAELKLQKAFFGLATRKYNTELKKKQKHDLYEPIIEEHTNAYLDYIQSIVHAFPTPPHIAVERKLDLTEYVPEGFGTSDCIIIGAGRLHIIDYKNGSGVPVPAEENPQMMIYALGAYKAFSMWFPITEVHVAIVQPKVWDTPSEWSLPVADLLAWGESIKPIAQQAYNGEGDFLMGDHCKFCRANGRCSAQIASIFENAKTPPPQPPPLSSWEDFGEAIKAAGPIATWLEKAKKLALAEALRGGTVPGWKAVEGRGKRDYVDLDKAFSHLKANGIDESVLYNREPLTPPQLEDALTRKVYKELLEDTGHVEKRTGAPTLAPDSDKRPAITNQVKPEDVFGTPPEQS